MKKLSNALRQFFEQLWGVATVLQSDTVLPVDENRGRIRLQPETLENLAVFVVSERKVILTILGVRTSNGKRVPSVVDKKYDDLRVIFKLLV